MIVGKHYDEQTVLDVAYTYEGLRDQKWKVADNDDTENDFNTLRLIYRYQERKSGQKINDAREDDYDTHRLIYTYYFIDFSIMISLTAIIQGSSRLFILHGEYQTLLSVFIYTRISLIANSWGQHGAHLGLVGPMLVPWILPLGMSPEGPGSV